MATCVPTGKSYIGYTTRTLDKRRKDHLSDARAGLTDCRKFWAAIRKYGEAAFEWRVLIDGLTQQDAADLERVAITTYGTLENGYNCSPGGEAATVDWAAVRAKHLLRHGLTPERLEEALAAVRVGGYLQDVAEQFGVPRANLWAACREAGIRAPHGRTDRKRHPLKPKPPKLGRRRKPPPKYVGHAGRRLRNYDELVAAGLVTVSFEEYCSKA